MTREQSKYQKPDIQNVTAKIFSISKALENEYKNTQDFPALTYKDVDEHSIIQSVLFWAQGDLYYSAKVDEVPDYVKEFLTFDEDAPYRGNYKRTEIGEVFPEIIDTRINPGDPLQTKKQYYIPINQDISAPIADTHLRSLVDWQMFDFAVHFNTSTDYFRIQDSILARIVESIGRSEKLFVDTFLVSLFGGYAHCYPVTDPLFRFFSDDEITPEAEFSKDANEFYKKDGKHAKKAEEIAKYTQAIYKSKRAYLTNIIVNEVTARTNVDRKIPKVDAVLPDMSDKVKTLSAIRSGYLAKGDDQKYVNPVNNLRRSSLYALSNEVASTVRKLCRSDNSNGCGHEYYKNVKDNKMGMTLKTTPGRLMVFMNEDDLDDALNELKGSEVMGMYTESPNQKIQRLKASGVAFYGLPFILPGTAAFVDRLAFSIKEYYNGDFQEFHAVDLVTSKIKHSYKKFVLYSKVVAEVIVPGQDQNFVPSPAGCSRNLPYLTETE